MSVTSSNTPDKPKKVLKFRPINKNSGRIFLNKELFFSYVEDFNDPFEFVMRFENEELGKGLGQNTVRHRLCVLCVSEENTKDEILLWSHYADNHKGIAIEFTPDYSDEKSIFSKLYKIRYDTKIPNYNSSDNEEGIIKALTTKADNWKYEKEWRRIFTRKIGDPVTVANSNGLEIDIGRVHNFKPEELSKVIIGCKTSREDERAVIHWVNQLGNPHVEIEKAYLDQSEYKLGFERIL